MGNGITRDTFKEMDSDAKLLVLFDLQHQSYECSCETAREVTELKGRFEKRKRLDTAASGFFGLVGGMVAMFVKGIVSK